MTFLVVCLTPDNKNMCSETDFTQEKGNFHPFTRIATFFWRLPRAMNNFLLRMLGRNDCDKDAVIPFPLKVTYFKVNNESDDGERWRHGKVLSLLSLFTCVRAAVNSFVLRSSEITFGLLIIFFILPYFFVVISNFNMPSFLQENEKSSERSELRFTVPTSWELQLWSITILAPKCILNAPQSSKIEQFLPFK